MLLPILDVMKSQMASQTNQTECVELLDRRLEEFPFYCYRRDVLIIWLGFRHQNKLNRLSIFGTDLKAEPFKVMMLDSEMCVYGWF